MRARQPPVAASIASPIASRTSASVPPNTHEDQHREQRGQREDQPVLDEALARAGRPARRRSRLGGLLGRAAGRRRAASSAPSAEQLGRRSPSVAARLWISRQVDGGSADDRLAPGGLERIARVGAAVLDHRRERRRQVLALVRGVLAPGVRRRASDRPARRRATPSRAPRAGPTSRAAATTRSGLRAEVGRERLVEDPEQAALEVHRQPPVLAQRVELDRRRRPAGRARAPRAAGSARARGRRGPSAGRRR